MGIDGYTHDTMNLEDLTAKWQAFGWFTQRIDGHNFSELETAIDRAREEQSRPSMIVLDTVKGKGAFFAEGDLGNHNMKFDYETAQKACQLLG
jgi:transketolase